ncbi:hypothetical protein [Mesorhizobium onobrychidis]|uniref:hypothetical protein n=1 Tax=Mesorhizobium onobrychidis TaxID=2775404 RepID=UPI0021572E3B|nr:hypothetical protein [Mesorhizobium onobrychidis]
MLEEKKRCWRLNYAREFHLDVTPTIVNPSCNNGGELVPDKSLSEFKPNPKGYWALFEKRALMRPRLKVQKAIAADRQANIEPFPVHIRVKGILRQTVQLLKRHRDIYFFDIEADIAPISIVITTLAAQAYEYCVNTFTFDSALDVVIATIRMMPHFIDRPFVNGQRMYVVANETTIGENFAERWNKEPARATAFMPGTPRRSPTSRTSLNSKASTASPRNSAIPTARPSWRASWMPAPNSFQARARRKSFLLRLWLVLR